MSKKTKTAFVCEECGADYPRWNGQCTACGAWNSIKEVRLGAGKSERNKRTDGYSGIRSSVQALSDVDLAQAERLSTGISEFDRVLGGGVVRGSVTLIGGAPGAGKSTILLQAIADMARRGIDVLYVSGEESLQQIAERAHRLNVSGERINMLAETSVQNVCDVLDDINPQVLVVDSIQVMYTQDTDSAPGSVSQVRESASYLTQYAKRHNVSVFLVGHVTKDQSLAGPMTLSHIVDTQVVLSSTNDARFRVLRADKNRFGSVGELGFFAMDSTGLKEVKNPSAMFLNRAEKPSSGSVVTVLWEGTRPLLVEIQALVTECQYGNPRRLAVGFDQNRLAMLLAILSRHGGIFTANDEIYANVVGGIKVTETSSDLAIVVGIVSSLKDKIIPHDTFFFGELGLNGEIRPVANGLARINDAAKHGFKKAVIPKSNAPKKAIEGLRIYPVANLAEALDVLGEVEC
ncbi:MULTISPECIES: DNA repair protein RadA [Methylotuvimicrobium]|uniref:DNA repair protein RadA n=1 Tax=Methylotuvimicrobium alcaliphilum (strain DSM 19304 / NCIMB 14124 / VKM B-2133 / 20Z) TaxID=1091494 RepID=G4T334_META2|nr:DNA repair protein RadA [Methylotuvimicrobium alcaliphilum]MBU2571730.1 DNA repair protein RadA [Gammaproteobacteria bacterium]CCE24776.1 DNA repair protein RadA (DNA repair protein Sms) [Methylotuvimicrobium alcaliphilum 20Z]